MRAFGCVVFIVLGMGIGLPSEGCTTFMVTDSAAVLLGDSEDAGPGHPLAVDPANAYAFILPAAEDAFGRIHLGWLWQGEHRSFQAGMNEHGLAYALTETPAVRMTPHPEKPYQRSKGNLFDRLLREASRVTEALHMLQQTGFGELSIQIQLVDAQGDSAVVSPGLDGELAISRKATADRFQVASTFNVAHPDSVIGRDSYERYQTAEDILRTRNTSHRALDDLALDTLAAVHRERAYALGGTYTVYSTLYDPVNLVLVHYPVSDFDHPIRIDLRDELLRGERSIPLRTLSDSEPLERSLQRYHAKQVAGIGVAAVSVLGIVALVTVVALSIGLR